MWRPVRLGLALWWALLLFGSAAGASTPKTGFLDRVVSHDGSSHRYQVYVPKDWSKKQKWPVILSLHGAGERGDDGLLQTQIGMAAAIRRYKKPFPAIVVFPQCLAGHWWTEPAMLRRALEALEASLEEFNGDRSRVYVTGLSMGGSGSWELAARYPGKFAAVVVVCGAVLRPPALDWSEIPEKLPSAGEASDPFRALAERIGKMPVWIFHGDADDTVPVEDSRRMDQALRAAGGNVRYSEYPAVRHNAWVRAYAEADLFPWLFSQRLK